MIKFSFFLVFLVSQATAEIRISLEPSVEPPSLLSQTGLFEAPVSELKPTENLTAFQINQPLWVDHAIKQRWIHLLPNSKIEIDADGELKFPVGAILLKHFDMEIAARKKQKIETRLLIRKNGEGEIWEAYTYRWTGSDAELVAERESPVVEMEILAGAVGGARRQNFQIPNRRQCLMCHNSSLGFVRSYRINQLNREVNERNQLELPEIASTFRFPPIVNSSLPALANVFDEEKSLEDRVKSYLSVNCAHCHNPNPKAICGFVGLDFRAKSIDLNFLTDGYYFKAGSKEQSEIYQRMVSTQRGRRMPMIGTQLVDENATSVIGRWIEQLKNLKP